MLAKTLTSLAVLGAALTVAGGAGARPVKEQFDLKGEVYPSFKIEMQTAAGRPLTTLKAGTYRIKVEDKASIHDFHLIGPGINKATSIAGVGETIWTVRLKPGKYTYVCDAHASSMRGSFRVTAG
jgi:plastocyanin